MASKGEKAKQKILAVAEKLFAYRGFDATSVESIASEAGVNKALIYYYFKDKNDLVNSLFINIIKQLNDHLKESHPPPASPAGPIEIKQKIKNEIQFLEKRKEILALLFMEALKGDDKDGFLFQCARLVIDHEVDAFKKSYEVKREAMPDLNEFLVFEFFTGFIPVLAFIVFKDKWCRFFKCQEEELMDLFLTAFSKTHLSAHGTDR
jgi:AcrR family transcriptional regulator